MKIEKKTFAFVAMVATSIVFLGGCDGFGPAPLLDTDAGESPVVDNDAGERSLPATDGGMRMPPLADAGEPLGDVPRDGETCDSDRDSETYDCAREGCDRAYLVCLGNGRWTCVPDTGAVCTPTPRPETDAGTLPVEHDAGGSPRVEIDAGSGLAGECVPGTTDACSLDCGVEGVRFCLASATYDTICRETATHRCPAPTTTADAGTSVVTVDAGPACEAGTFVGCWRDCLGYEWPGHVDCVPGVGYFGQCREFVGLECSSIFGTDAGPPPAIDAGTDSGPPAIDAGTDSGPPPAIDAGTDAGPPPVVDAGSDAGPPPVETRTITLMFTVPADLLQSSSSMDFLEEMAGAGATRADARPAACDSGTAGIVTMAGREWFRCRMTRPIGAELFFVGRFRSKASVVDGWSEGQILGTMSGWGRRGCGSEAATAHVLWSITDAAGRSLLNPDGLPDIVQPRAITEDGYPVCRGRFVFGSSLP